MVLPSIPTLPSMRDAITGTPHTMASDTIFAPPSMTELITMAWLGELAPNLPARHLAPPDVTRVRPHFRHAPSPFPVMLFQMDDP